MATHSSILAWRIPRTEEPGGLPSMGSHRVGPDWSDLAAAAAAAADCRINGIMHCTGLLFLFYFRSTVPFRFLHIAAGTSSTLLLLLSGIPFCGCSAICISTRRWIFTLFLVLLYWGSSCYEYFVYRSLWNQMFSFNLDKQLRVGLPGIRQVIHRTIFWGRGEFKNAIG